MNEYTSFIGGVPGTGKGLGAAAAVDPLYVIPDCPGEDPAGDWREMGWDTPVNAAIGHLGWCRKHQPGALQSSAAIKAWKALTAGGQS